MQDTTITDWIEQEHIKNEKGDQIDFIDHFFLFDIYEDQSQYICVMKPAQAGLSTLEILKTIYDAKANKMDIIYTLPADSDVNIFVGGKVNRIIAQNPPLTALTKDKDSIEQKQIGESMIYFRGTWSHKAAIMVTADRIVNDEKDSSKQDVVKEYEARLQHSKFKQKHVFSHPSAPNFGVDVEWQESDQKEWFIKCKSCGEEQFLQWDLKDKMNMSIDIERGIFVCQYCGAELDNNTRAVGRWRAKDFGYIPKYSGYHISLLMCPWISAKEILDKYNDKDSTEEFFYNKVLGLPYAGAGNKLSKEQLFQNLSNEVPELKIDDRIIIGIDTGLKLDYVYGTDNGLYYHGEAKNYDELDALMNKYPRALAFIDAGGDLIGSRQFQTKWQGRVWLCYLGGSTKQDTHIWNDSEYSVRIDRNKTIQLLVDEFSKALIPLKGSESDWWEYWLDWNNLRRLKIVDNLTNQFKEFKWSRSGRDHRALATVNWRVGFSRFYVGSASFVGGEDVDNGIPQAPIRTVDGKMEMFKLTLPESNTSDDWRKY